MGELEVSTAAVRSTSASLQPMAGELEAARGGLAEAADALAGTPAAGAHAAAALEIGAGLSAYADTCDRLAWMMGWIATAYERADTLHPYGR